MRLSPLAFQGLLFTWVFLLSLGAAAQPTKHLPDTVPLTTESDLSAQMVSSVDQFLLDQIDKSVKQRERYWHRDYSSREAYEQSVTTNREHLRHDIGAIDQRLSAANLEFVGSERWPARVADNDFFTVTAVRWPVLENVYGEGLLLEPKTPPIARVIALPDADQTPEMLAGRVPGLAPEAQFARRLAENGCIVLIPVIIDRNDTWSGNEQIGRFTNQPHREWIYRQAFEMGRHIIGYEVEKVLAAVDWCLGQTNSPPGLRERESRSAKLPVGVVGYGEGGLIAFYSAALDSRINAAWVSGYFDSRQRVWEEPIYRNVWGLLDEFGDAEIASLIAPRPLVIEFCRFPEVAGPPARRNGRSGAAPGKLKTPEFASAAQEFERAKALFPPDKDVRPNFQLVGSQASATHEPGSEAALATFLRGLAGPDLPIKPSGAGYHEVRPTQPATERQRRQVKELEAYSQRLLAVSDRARDQFFWNTVKPNSPTEWATAVKPFRERMWTELIGQFPPASTPLNPRTRQILESEKWNGYDVVLDVWPGVFAWGVLLVPKDIGPNERRPVVVCQHGLEGVPLDTIKRDVPGFNYYKAFSAQLADRGYVVFAPFNLYRGGDLFRVLQRKANPLKKSLFSIIVAQQDRILDWLGTLPYVDAQRIGFYGLSYGGKTAMRVPALLDRYVLSICSGDFNDWNRKNITVDSPYSYTFTGEYELPEFDLGSTFNYAEMAALIAPRPFMVERGHHDGVAPDEWVAYEYAKVRRLYSDLGISERTSIEFFDGPHTIHGVGTFEFLGKHLHWPK